MALVRAVYACIKKRFSESIADGFLGEYGEAMTKRETSSAAKADFRKCSVTAADIAKFRKAAAAVWRKFPTKAELLRELRKYCSKEYIDAELQKYASKSDVEQSCAKMKLEAMADMSYQMNLLYELLTADFKGIFKDRTEQLTDKTNDHERIIGHVEKQLLIF